MSYYAYCLYTEAQDRPREVRIFASGPESVAGNSAPGDPGRRSGEEQQAPHYPTLTGCPEDAPIGSLDKVTEPIWPADGGPKVL